MTKKKGYKMTEETINKEEDQTQEENVSESSEIIEISWPEAESIWKIREILVATEEEFKTMSLSYEKKKAILMSKIAEAQNALYHSAESLRREKNIDEELVYELKLPTTTGEKAYFIRKDV